MIAAIVERLKVRLDEDDPAFILVELNKLAPRPRTARLKRLRKQRFGSMRKSRTRAALRRG